MVSERDGSDFMLTEQGESAFSQDEYEDAMIRFDELGVKLSIMYASCRRQGY